MNRGSSFATVARTKKGLVFFWIALFVLSMGMQYVSAMTPQSVLAAVPSFNFIGDDAGANDEPGQKDLTALASATDGPGGDFYSAFKWDDTSWSGNNTGDGCQLFDTDGDGNVNFAVCVTIAGQTADELSTRVYSCGDRKVDRCTNPIKLLGTEAERRRLEVEWCVDHKPRHRPVRCGRYAGHLQHQPDRA